MRVSHAQCMRVESSAVIRFCQANNTWTDEHPFCKIKHCVNLEPPANAYVATKPCPTEFTSSCEIQCVDGYYIVDDDTPFYQTLILLIMNYIGTDHLFVNVSITSYSLPIFLFTLKQ